MKFTIDTTRKTIVIEETTNFSTFVELIQKILGDEWKEYSLEKTSSVEWYFRDRFMTPAVIPVPDYSTTLYPNIPNYPSIICYDSKVSVDSITTYNYENPKN